MEGDWRNKVFINCDVTDNNGWFEWITFKHSLWRISLEDWGKVCIYMCVCVCVCMYVCMYMCCAWLLSYVQLFVTPWTVAHQAPLSMEDSPGKNTGVDCHALQGIFPTQEWNWGLLHCRWILYLLSYLESPYVCVCVCFIHLFIEYNWLSVSFTCTAQWFSTLLLSPSHCIYTHRYIYIKSITYNRFYI